MTRAAVVVAFAVMAGLGAVGCQASAPPTQAAAPAPDLSGIWGARFMRSLADDPPFLPEARKRYEETKGEDDPLNGCLPAGVPRLNNLNFAFEIVQTPAIVYFLFEYDQVVRRVFIDGKHPENTDPTYYGHSIGHWEGKTLVVDTVGFNDETWLDMQGHLHSDALHLIERFTRSDDGQSLTYEVTVDDPKIYSEPWQAATKSHPLRNDLQIQEFICQS